MKKTFKYILCAFVALMTLSCTTTTNSKDELQQMVDDMNKDMPMVLSKNLVLTDMALEDSCVRYKYNVIDTVGLVSSIATNHLGITLQFEESLSEAQFKEFVKIVVSCDKDIVYSYKEVKSGMTTDVTITKDEIKKLLAEPEE